MGKRVVCLICAAVLVAIALLGVRTRSESWEGSLQMQPTVNELRLSKGIVKHSPNPLASAMFLILAGIGISLLFDKKDKH